MSQGHIRPLLDITKALSNLGVKISIITTPSNAPSIIPHIGKHPQIHLVEITFPSINGLPEGCENTDQLPSVDFLVPLLNSTRELKQPFQRVLKEMVESHSHPICVISDFFLGWTVDTCHEFDIPRLVFHGMGALSMAISKSMWRK
ncbi:hypothetical protein Dsin_008759 [Dipteronia sinensis]|uniref:Uncharacterized protein n=1 Tax=Dipteronia sinensis TaxID=43782 RepID=A0AAE0AQE7_9ROSI|nr:hypothetical protein Dsin_008759 [Dipteronia sinensis]